MHSSFTSRASGGGCDVRRFASKPCGVSATSRRSTMSRQTTSIKRDILLGAIGLLVVLGAGLFLYVRNFSLNAADTAFDRVLAASCLLLAGNIRGEDADLTLVLPLDYAGG